MLNRFLSTAVGTALLVVGAATGAVAQEGVPPPLPEAAAHILVNGSTGEVLAGEDADIPLAMASTTKIMTALVVLERADLDDRYTVPAEALIGGSSADLVVGEQVSVRDLMTGLMVASGNDAAITLAVGLAGSQEAFVALMNEQAAALGLTQTRYANVHGLDAPEHHTTVRELVALSRAAMRNPLFRTLAGERSATIPGPHGRGLRQLESNNLLLDSFPEADGIKTGMTNQAGYTLAAHAQRKRLGVSLYVALIGASSSEGRARDAERLLRWGFSQYARPMLVRPGAVVGEIPVQYRPNTAVPYRVERGVRPPIRLGEAVTEEIVAPRQIAGPVREGQVVGELTFRQGERVLARRDLVAAESVADAGILDRVRSGLGALLP